MAEPALDHSAADASVITGDSDTPAPSAPPSPRRRQSESSLRSCFICLDTSVDTPEAVWVNPCPCSLEAHEACMLHWISQQELHSAKTLQCPACKARIKLWQPSDPAVTLQKNLLYLANKVSPFILALFAINGVGLVGLQYGTWAVSQFAGAESRGWWLNEWRLLFIGTPKALRMIDAKSLFSKSLALMLLAPTVLIHRALPQITCLSLMAPASVTYFAYLLGANTKVLVSFSPSLAACLFPWVNLAYDFGYFSLFGRFERRLNRALKGRPPSDQQLNGGPPAEQDDDEANESALSFVGRMLTAVIRRDGNAQLGIQIGRVERIDDLVAQGPQEMQQEIDGRGPGVPVIENVERGGAERIGEPMPAYREPDTAPRLVQQNGGEDIVWVGEDTTDAVVEIAGPQSPVENDANAIDALQVAAEPQIQVIEPVVPPLLADGAEVEAEAAALPPLAAPPHDDADNAQQVRDHHHEIHTSLTTIATSIVSALMFPAVARASGALLYVCLPYSVTKRPRWGPPTSIFQQQWGRSLVGGAMYIVIRDMFDLYAKYRRVEIRKRRHVQNVPRRGVVAGAGP